MSLAIAVMSCGPHQGRRDAIWNTWDQTRRNRAAIHILIGDVEADEGIRLPCGDGYEDCGRKQWEMLKYFAEFDYDHVFFCDDDTYVVVDRLLTCGYEQHDYFGCSYYYTPSQVLAHGGAGFFLSRKAIKAALDVGIDAVMPSIFSDIVVGELMDKAKIPLVGSWRFNKGHPAVRRNVYPNRDNDYITSHYLTPKDFEAIYLHLERGEPIRPNGYGLNNGQREARFIENKGKWYYKPWHQGEQATFPPWVGPFDYCQEAEEHAFNEKGAS